MEAHEASRWDRKNAAIMEAAATVFLRNGYLGTNLDEIATLAAVSKQTVYKHFSDKEQLFTAIILATTGRVSDLIQVVSATLTDTDDLHQALGDLAGRFISVLMQPELLQLRRLVIATADRFPDLGRTWYENGFERVLATLAGCFAALAERGRLRVDDPHLAANHFVGLLLWIPVNRAMFTGDNQGSSDQELARYAEAAVRVFLAAYGPP